ncbi:MAG: HEAT repeat domain-containing protein [Verrucomicrobiota bacterium]
MKRKLQLAGALLLMAVAVMGWSRWRANTDDPMCQGHRFSHRLFELAFAHPNPARGAADSREAIRAMGTNAIPLLLEYISTDDTSWEYLIKNVLTKPFSQMVIRPAWRPHMGAAGFEALGPLGQPAVPQLVKLLEERRSSLFEVTRALGSTRDPRAYALFCDYLTQSDAQKRIVGAYGLEVMKEEARPMVERLIEISKQDKDDTVRASAVGAAGSAGEGKVVVPYLIYMLQNDTNDTVRFCAAMALGNHPKYADISRPVLNGAVQSGPMHVANGARIGLQKLDEVEFLANLKGPANAAILRSLTNGVAK